MQLAIEGDRRLTVRELENDLGIPKTTVWEISNKVLGMTYVCAKFIPKFPGRMEATSRSEVAVAQALLGGLMHVIRLSLDSW